MTPQKLDVPRALLIATLATAIGCSDSKSSSEGGKGGSAFAPITKAWKAAELKVELEPLDDSEVAIANGECRRAEPQGLSLRLCRYDDVLMADAARAEGEASIGAATGFALARDRFLLVVADPDDADPHGKVMNELAATFMQAADGSASAGEEPASEESKGLSDLMGG